MSKTRNDSIQVTFLAGIVHQDDLVYESPWRPVDDAPDRAQQSRPCLVVKHYHDARVGQLVYLVRLPLTTTTHGSK